MIIDTTTDEPYILPPKEEVHLNYGIYLGGNYTTGPLVHNTLHEIWVRSSKGLEPTFAPGSRTCVLLQQGLKGGTDESGRSFTDGPTYTRLTQAKFNVIGKTINLCAESGAVLYVRTPHGTHIRIECHPVTRNIDPRQALCPDREDGATDYIRGYNDAFNNIGQKGRSTAYIDGYKDGSYPLHIEPHHDSQ